MARSPIPRTVKKNPYVNETLLPVVTVAEQSPAFKIFHTKYLCKIANIHTETVEAMQRRQPMGNESPSAALATARQLRPVYLTAAAMAELMVEGATIHLVEMDKAHEIYINIRDHLQNWAREVEFSLNSRQAPVEDLRALDMFAAVIYPHARSDIEAQQSNHLRNTLFGGQLNHTIFSRHNAEEKAAIDQAAGGTRTIPLAHDPMLDSIANPPATMVKSKWGPGS